MSNHGPLGEGARVGLLDQLRGIAILGILLVNVPLFFAPIHEEMLPQIVRWPAPLDQSISAAIVFFARGKFYSLFSLLFGVGLALQIDRLERRGTAPGPFLVRRLLGLLVLGAFHALFVWFGDILVLYALSGLVAVFLIVIPLSRARPGAIAGAGGMLLIFPTLLVAAIVGLVQLVPPDQRAELDTIAAESRAESMAHLERAHEVYPAGGVSEILQQRLVQLRVYYRSALFFGANVLGLFLLGAAGFRAGWLSRLERSPGSSLRRLAPLAALAIPANLWFALNYDRIDGFEPSAAAVLQVAALSLCGLFFALLYAHLVALARVRRLANGLFERFAAVGRMALTNYLLQSLLFTFLANGYGLGLYGRISPTAGLGLSLAVFSFQLILSPWWLARFRFGPAEWLWRCWSYGQFQQFLRSKA